MRNFLLLCLFLVSIISSAQDRKSVQGRISLGTDDDTPTHVRVQNISTKKITPTTGKGYFTVIAKAGDTISLFSPEFATVQYILTKDDMSKDLIHLSLTTQTNMLKEVKVTSKPGPNIGYQPADQKHYSKSERRVKTAKNKSINRKADEAFIGVKTDPLLNRVTGRTKELEKNLEVEKKEKGISILNSLFEEDYFISNLKIPSEYISGFQYYAVESPKLLQLLEIEDKENVDLELSRLSQDYLQLISDEKK